MLTVSYQGVLNSQWSIFGGGSYTRANNKQGVIDQKINSIDNAFHAKLKLKKQS